MSTGMQASEVLSLDAQQAAIEGYCALHEIKLLGICKDANLYEHYFRSGARLILL